MPSKYIFSRLAQTPFRKPTPSKVRLAQEFIDELDVRRQSIEFSDEQEVRDWLKPVNDALAHSSTKDAKKYVWDEFAHALSANDEPHLFLAGYQWLQENKEWAPAQKKSLLDWKEDTSFSLASLLSARSELPQSKAINYIVQWLDKRQKELWIKNDACFMLPMQKILLNEYENPFYSKREHGYRNQILWEHVLAPALPFLPNEIKNTFNIPDLPFIFEDSFVKALLSMAEPEVHTWILSNGLFASDFSLKTYSFSDDRSAIKSLSKFVSALSNSQEKAFCVWDMINRRNDLPVAAHIVKHHFPHMHTLLDNLNMLTIQDMRQAMLLQWNQPSETIPTLELPADMHNEPTL